MADWTDADQRQLDRLEAQANQLESQIAGDPAANNHVAAISQPATPEDQAAQSAKGFSTVRMLLGAGRDILEAPLSFTEGVGNYLEEKLPLPMLRFGKNASNGIVDMVSGQQAADFTKANDGRLLPHIPDVPGSENGNVWEHLGRNLISFGVPFAGWLKKLGAAEAGLGVVGRIVRGAEAGFATDFVNQPPDTTNLATAIKDTYGLDDPTLNWLAYNSEDNQLVQRLKAAATNVPVGVAADGLFALGGKLIQAYARGKGDPEVAKGVIEAMEHDYGIKTAERPSAAASADAEAGGVQAAVPSEEPFNPARDVGIQNRPQSWEDVLSYLERQVNDPNLTQDELHQLAKIAEGDPENALARMGIEPSKLDWQEFSNPEGIQRLHQSLIDIYDKIGQRLGRTGETVTEGMIHTAARSLASEADVLKTLFGATKNLPEILMGARMFVGSHAHVLLQDATDALAALRKGDGGAEWQKFLESFHRHALYLGTVRGAGSEIGRALKSLQFLARNGDLATAKGIAKETAAKVPAGASADAAEAASQKLNSLLSMKDDAQKIMVLSQILEKKGDVGDLAQFVRGESGNFLKRADGIMRETTSNLFSAGTAAYNVKSGLSILAMRALGRWMAAGVRALPALFSPEQARLFRIAAADAWFYSDGIVFALNNAIHTTMKEMEREASAELYINADNLGLKKLAKKAALMNADSNAAVLGKNFERVDVNATARRFAFNPADRQKLEELADSEGLPQAVFRSLMFITRSVGAGANALGTLTRAGTILLINAPDQFVGTLAAKAGAQSAAVREAAMRAAELGIEGKALSQYLKARVASLATDISGWSNNGFEDGYRAAVAAAGEHEARQVLFQDPIESPSMRRISQAVSKAHFGSFFVPFPHTPVRILERTLIDYTPLGLLKDRMRQAIFHGTPQQREQALAQLTLGSFLMYQGYKMAQDRGIVGSDGGFTSTARLNRESFTMRIGADVYEFIRDNPLGNLLGLGADLKAAIDHMDPNDPQHQEVVKAIAEAGAWSLSVNVLSQTWLTSLKDITDLAGAYTDGQFAKGLEKYLKASIARRIVPGAGLQKSVEAAFDPFERQALTFQEEMLKYTIGASKLPVKRNLLGEPEEKNLGERFLGLTWAPEKTNDPLIKELDRLSIPSPLPNHDISGVPLTAAQYSRLLELRGQVVKGDNGTMNETLRALISHPAYAGLTDPTKADQIRQYMDGFTAKAKQALLAEDPVLHAQVIQKQAYDQGRVQNMTPDQLKQQNEQLGRELGLTQ